ncbi:MAG: hypothetical protein AAFN59_12160 [Pseudomonadota bacterium]
MHCDVQELKTFYYRRRLGRAAKAALVEQITHIWPDVSNETLVGFGFSVPVLRPFLKQARRTVALMPGPQGVMRWPPGQENISVLCQETLWPMADGMADRLIILHGLEGSEHPAALLSEAYRVLSDTGRAILVVPHRGGLWARRDVTPFGIGRPYSAGQIDGLLYDHGFLTRRHAAALFQPPSEKTLWIRTGRVAEKIGQKLSGSFAGGVLIIEFAKEMPPRPNLSLRAAMRRPLRILDGIPVPDPKPASARQNRVKPTPKLKVL